MTRALRIARARPQRTASSWSRPAGALLLVLLCGACPKDPPVTAIEIVPSKVVVGSDPLRPTTFELEARLWTGPATDRRSISESQGYKSPKWKASHNWLELINDQGFRSTLEIKAGPVPTAPATVTVKAGGKTATAEVSVVSDVIVGQDALKATYTEKKAPAAVIVNGILDDATGPCSVNLAAFVTRTKVGKVVENCPGADAGWGAAVLAVNHQLMFTPGAWSLPDNLVDAVPLQGTARSLPVALRVMVGNSPLAPTNLVALRNDVLAAAKAEIGAANTLLAQTRAGIQLIIVDPQVIDVPDEVAIYDCLIGDELTLEQDKPGVLNVYYVNTLGGYRGLSCGWHDGRKQDVIYVGWENHSATTFLHEMGHALGLTLPGQGHTDMVAGLDRTNVMTSGDDDLDPAGRHRLSVGQVFRMNADSASWLNWAVNGGTPVREAAAPRVACQCGEADPAGRCPRLADDLAQPSEVPGIAYSWDCFDQLQLAEVVEADDESPVAIIAGRRWRAPPGRCSTDMPGWTEKHWLATYVKFENLTHPGICDSWAAIFFRRHGVMYLNLAGATSAWSKAADQWPVNESMPTPVLVIAHVYYAAAVEGTVRQDVEHARVTFGASNRTGIDLMFDLNPGTCPSPATNPGSHELIVCYASGGAAEADLVSAGRIKVWLGKRTASTLSHFLGRALDLDVLDGAGSGFPDNIMQRVPADRGQKLTLGQVFRINTFLTPASLPSCDPGPCPSLGADVTP